LVRELEHLDFVGAVEHLAARAGIQLRYTDKSESKERQRRARLIDAMAKAVEWYHDRLLTGADAKRARGYLRSRGHDGEIVRQYKIGWAPDEWDALAKALKLPDDVLRDTGLGFLNRRNRQQDAFRARILFPIFDAQGDPVAFGGRKLPDADGPKYKNSPETPIYHKSKVLYGLNWAKNGIVEANEAILCEGYTDVIGFGLAGVPRAVATCGTALTEDHIRTLKRFATRVVLAFDADAAGQAAADRIYEWERTYEIDVAVAALPAGADPGDLARSDPAALALAVKDARPFLGFRVDRVLASADLRSAEGRARGAEHALEVVREHPSDFVRDQYLMEIADRCRIDVARLRERLAGARPLPRPRADDRPRPRRDRNTPELEALRLALNDPEAVADHLDEVLFTDELHVRAFRALASTATVHDAIEAAGPEVGELLQRLAVEESDAEPGDVIARLLEAAAARAIADLEAEMRTADDPLGYAPVMGWIKLRTQELREPATALGAADQLLAWLVERAQEG
ncbi:MAG TPA: toprim domain-containing protein, partial [Acidimicrobiales bacterium]|nr:toprim domain-containing protein [Acidimicrobiales bacterium]